MSPLVKSSSRPIWCRIPHKNVYYYRCPEHRRNYVMSFAFCFDREEDTYQFSYCYPYTYSMMQNYLDALERKGYPHFKRDLLGTTLQQRRLDLLTITHPRNISHNSSAKRRTICVTARVHPGETPSSYVCQGFIDFMVSSHPVAEELRYHLVFKIVPMLNPDGVYLGNYRCSLMGFDLNRQWQDPSQWAHPTIYATKQLLMKLDQTALTDVNFFIDIHAHSTLMNGFMYGNVFEDEERAERQAVFPNLLSQFAEDFSLPQTNFNRDAVKAGTGRRTLGGILDDRTLCYTLEVSFFSYANVLTGEMIPYTEEKYARLGRNLARTFYEYYVGEGIFKRSTTLADTPRGGAKGDLIEITAGDDHQSQTTPRWSEIKRRSLESSENGSGDFRPADKESLINRSMDKAFLARTFSTRLNDQYPTQGWKTTLGGVSWRIAAPMGTSDRIEQTNPQRSIKSEASKIGSKEG
ncbi:unnamed protein product [Calicophoron daubneyi]